MKWVSPTFLGASTREQTTCDVCDQEALCHVGFARDHRGNPQPVIATCCRCSGCSHVSAEFAFGWGAVVGKVARHKDQFRVGRPSGFVRSVARYLHREEADRIA